MHYIRTEECKITLLCSVFSETCTYLYRKKLLQLDNKSCLQVCRRHIEDCNWFMGFQDVYNIAELLLRCYLNWISLSIPIKVHAKFQKGFWSIFSATILLQQWNNSGVKVDKWKNFKTLKSVSILAFKLLSISFWTAWATTTHQR